MDAQTIFLAKLSTTRGVRSGIVQVTLTQDEDWGDEYVATCQIAGSPVEQLYKGEDAAQARVAVEDVIDDHDLFVKRSATSLAGVAASEITPTQVLINFSS